MTNLWPYGRVILTNTGFHGEFYRQCDDFMSLMYLGKTREEVVNLMYRLVNQNIDIDSKKYFFIFQLLGFITTRTEDTHNKISYCSV